MRFSTRAPGPRLAPHVESLWLFESARASGADRVLPSGRMQLIVDLEARAGGLVTGPRTRPVDLPASPRARMLGAVFRPGGAAPFLSVPCEALAELDAPLEALWGAPARAARDWLHDAPSPDQALARLARVLEARLDPALAAGPALAAARAALERGAAVGEVADRTGLSTSTLRRRFLRALGLSPKQYAGVHRFQRAVHRLAAANEDLAEVAVAVGYFDQAHMTRAFDRFGGLTPGAYRPLPIGPNHVAAP